ncbi:MAG: hypothetical protein ABII06_05215 [Pseudomonadota bacterium]
MKIVNLGERIESRKRKRQVDHYRGKIEALKKIIQCSSCHIKCAMCGLHVEFGGTAKETRFPPFGLIFCESCRAEFQDFLSVSRGEKPSGIFWHNQEWKNMWSAWLNYRRAINAFTDSREFRELLEEIDRHS